MVRALYRRTKAKREEAEAEDEDQAELIYEQHLKTTLERSHSDEFVAIEPVSGDYFLGRTLSEAVGAARKEHPEYCHM